jgi:hypothetical protein
MARKSRFTINYLFPSIADLFFIVILFLLFFFDRLRLLGDCDTGYHIRAGDFIIRTFTIPKQDIFSFHTPTLPWTAHEWLSELIMSELHSAFGLSGVVAFFAILLAFTTSLLFKTLRAYGIEIILATFISLLALTSFQLHWLARPHAFSFLFMVIFQYVLECWHRAPLTPSPSPGGRGEYGVGSRGGSSFNRLYLLPPLMLPWVNLHGGYLGGFILLGAYFIGNATSFISAATAGDTEKLRFSVIRLKQLGITIAACLAVCLINPRGYHILLFPFRLVSESFLMDHVSEFLSPNFHDGMPFKYLLLLLIALIALSRKGIEATELVLVLIFTNMSLYSVRYIPLFALVMAPMMCRLADERRALAGAKLVGFLQKRSDTLAEIDEKAKGCLWPVLASLIVLGFTFTGRIDHAFDPKIKPVAASEFLMKERISGNMFNDDEFGDYLIYRSTPTYKVFIDGRSDMYGTEILKEYCKVINFEQGWERVLDKYRVDWIFFGSKTPLSRFLLTDKQWVLIYSDSVANIFVRNIPKYQKLIQKYPSVKPAVL